MKKIVFFTGILFFLGCAEPTQPRDVNPEESSSNPDPSAAMRFVALEFVNGHVKNMNKLGKAEDILVWTNKSDLVTTEFKKALNILVEKAWADDPEMGLDADPIFNAQDYPEAGFEFDKMNLRDSLIALKGIGASDFKLNLRMKINKNKWLVDGCGMVNMAPR